MNMGIERVLKEKFGDAIKDIRQVFDGDQPPAETTPEVEELPPPVQSRRLDLKGLKTVHSWSAHWLDVACRR